MVINGKISIEELLLKAEGVVRYSVGSPIEVKPGVMSPIYINLKNTLPDFSVRHIISRKLAELIGEEPDYICGMESGGTYYASTVADMLLKPVILFRTKNKDYSKSRLVVGELPVKGSLVAIIDDVFATGLTVSKAVNYFRGIGCDVKVYSIFSYGFDKEIGAKLDVEVFSLSNFNNMCDIGTKMGIFTPDDTELLKDHVSTYKDLLETYE